MSLKKIYIDSMSSYMWKHIFVSLEFTTCYPYLNYLKPIPFEFTRLISVMKGQYSKLHKSIFSLNKNQANTWELGDSEPSVLLHG